MRRGRRRCRAAWEASLTSAAFVRLNYKLIAFYAYKFAASHRATTAKIKLAKCIYLVNWQTRLQLATCNCHNDCLCDWDCNPDCQCQSLGITAAVH